MSKSEAGKGDSRRPRFVSRERYEENYERWLKKVKENKQKDKKKED